MFVATDPEQPHSESQARSAALKRPNRVLDHPKRIAQSVSAFLAQVSEDPQDLLLPRLSGAKSHLLAQPGKLVRPLIVWLLGRAFDVPGHRLYPFALSVELLHNACLLHDDVIDDSTLRRRRPTANARYDNTLPILAGDCLLANSISEVASTGDVKAMQALASAIQDLASGEALQYELTGELHDDIQLCVEIAELKTGVLFSFGTWLPGHLAELPAERQAALASVGRNTGVCFQLIDDTLDFDAERSGKPALADWKEAKTNSVTAMLLQLDRSTRKPLERLFAQPSEDRDRLAQEILEGEISVASIAEALERVRELAREYAALADYHARVIPDNEPGRLFEELRAFLLQRLT